jgi:SAM-dependent methyltransferase
MYRVEDTHWWYLGMERITRAVLDRAIGRGRSLRILDAGCGTGAVMGYLSDYGTVTGFDFAAEALHFCRVRQRDRLSRASVLALPYADESFDLLTSFDVLCERAVVDDDLALREFARVLRSPDAVSGKPGGRVLLRLPAYNWLHGQHDEAVYIRHRYTARELKHKLRQAGFEPKHVSYANMLLFPAAVIKRASERFMPIKQQGSDLTIGTGLLNTPMRLILSAEAPFVARTGLPFGLTVTALGQRMVSPNGHMRCSAPVNGYAAR